MSNSLSVCNYLKKYKKLFSNEIYASPNKFKYKKIENRKSHSYDIDQYRSLISNCQECQLFETRKNFVFGSGDPNADLLLVGEAPGLEEDERGIPFVGRAGKLLDKILLAIGLNRYERVFILNVLKCRPPENRNPLQSEIEKCLPYLKQQIKFINPKLIVALGKVAAKSLTGQDIPLGVMRESTYEYKGIPLKVTYHPAALLRNQSLKKFAWEDFKWVKSQMEI